MQHYKSTLQVEAMNDERLDPSISELLINPDLIVAFRHSVLVNWYAEYITKEEHYNLAQSIVNEYAGYELYPAHIYYHCEMFARNKAPHRQIKYPINPAYKPAKRRVGYLYADLSDDLELSIPSENAPHTSEQTIIKPNTLIYDIWLHSKQGTITKEQLQPAINLQQKEVYSLYDDLTDNSSESVTPKGRINIPAFGKKKSIPQVSFGKK